MYIYHYDYIGNMRVVQNTNPGSGSAVDALYDYTPYGKLSRKYENIGSPYLTTGNERDTETDLDYRNMRFSDADLGVFLQVDPMDFARPEWSCYNFVRCNPILNTDPNGNLDDFYKTESGAIIDDKNITSQTDLDKAGIKGKYIGKSIEGNLKSGEGVAGISNDNYTVFSVSLYPVEISAQRSLNVSEFKSEVAALAPGLNAFANGMTYATYGAATIFSGGVGLSTELYTAKASLSVISQGSINGFSEIDYFDALVTDPFTSPGLGGAAGGAVDFKPFSANSKEKFKTIFNGSKSPEAFAMDASLGNVFGKVGDATWAPLKPMLNTTVEKGIMFSSTQMWNSTLYQGTNKAANDKFAPKK